MTTPLHAFAGYGVELEYMIVDRHSLSVRPIADELLRRAAEGDTAQVERGTMGWSNEVALHQIEIKNLAPGPDLESLPAAYQAEAQAINRLLEPMNARLMPTAMHPWMDPLRETRLWSGEHADIYRTYDRIFGCQKHGWSNIQSMHLNLPFADDAEFARLHAAVRLVLPILPALAASSPIAEGRPRGFMDFRMEAYRTHEIKIPALLGQVIPDTAASRADYEAHIFAPMYRDIAPFDPEGVLRHEWLNSRGAAPRFERNAIEIRVVDSQECPQADLAIAAAITAVVRALYDAKWASLETQQSIATDDLAGIFRACIHDGEQAVIDHAGYLQRLAFPGRRCRGGELWWHLVGATLGDGAHWQRWRQPLQTILEYGPLARRILRAVGPGGERSRLEAVYGELCRCLEQGRLFLGLN